MKNILFILFCSSITSTGISQTECDYSVSFFLRTKKGRLVNKIYRKEIDKHSYISKYFTKKNKHYFRIGRINDCNYQLILKKGNKELKLIFHNTKERISFANFGTLPMIDTTIHFYDGLRYKPIPASEIKDEMPKMVTIPKKETPFKYDSSNVFLISEYGGFKKVKVELVSNRIGIDLKQNRTNARILEPFYLFPKKNFDIYQLSPTRILQLENHNERHKNKLSLGKVYRLTFTELSPQRSMVVSHFGGYQVKVHNYISIETFETFAKTNNYLIMKTKAGGIYMYTLLCSINDLKSTYKIISESGLFSLIEPSFLNNSQNIHRNKGKYRKVINPFSRNGKPTIDSVEFYSVIMNDLPELGLLGYTKNVVTRNALYYKYSNVVSSVDINVKTRMKLSDSLFKEVQFMLTQLPSSYLDSTGNYGDCLVPLTQTSNYNCFTMIIYKNDGTRLNLQGNELPKKLQPYYYKAYRFNDRLRK